MTQATVKTVQYLDPRIEPQPDPVYDYVIGPTQNQYYQIPASGISNASITFNNLTTLGIDRAYLDTFEIELGIQIKFHVVIQEGEAQAAPAQYYSFPNSGDWTFDSFPFNKCCEEARVNINGGAFQSQPLSYIRAKERYMNQWELSKCYENICPCHRAILQTESGINYNTSCSYERAQKLNYACVDVPELVVNNYGTAGERHPAMPAGQGEGVPTRYGRGNWNYNQSEQGLVGSYNNAIVDMGVNNANYFIDHVTDQGYDVYVNVSWREPIFCSPFSSRYDATYGRPLYNITSMDLSFSLQNLGNMIRLKNYGGVSNQKQYIDSYNIDIKTAKLCYQVMTIPPILQKPLTTLVPYRRFVPYTTDFNQAVGAGGTNDIPINGGVVTIQSGVYTLNEMPTAIWVFLGPSKSDLQYNEPDYYKITAVAPQTEAAANWNNVNFRPSWDSNKLFGFIRELNISMANTTQILATAKVPDLYRIAKANGCEDSYWSWACYNSMSQNPRLFSSRNVATGVPIPATTYLGAGSVLRLKPGVDLIVPDQALISGANANNMVIQVKGTWYVPPHSSTRSKYSLWLLFEYVGVAAISPGQCEITMNPLGSGEIMAVSPVMSATSDITEGTIEGSGFWDRMKKSSEIAGKVSDQKAISQILRQTPGAASAVKYAADHDIGAPGMKRSRGGAVSGGAVIGKGLNDWV